MNFKIYLGKFLHSLLLYICMLIALHLHVCTNLENMSYVHIYILLLILERLCGNI